MLWDVISRLEGVLILTFLSIHPSKRLLEQSRMLEKASREHEGSVGLVSYSAMLALCVNESVYPSSLRSFNCCSENKHVKYQHSGVSNSQRH